MKLSLVLGLGIAIGFVDAAVGPLDSDVSDYPKRLIWRDNQLFNFSEDDIKGLNDELKKQGESDKAVKNDTQLAA